MRMLWSRKTKKGVDVGRVQTLVTVVKNKEIDNNKIKEYQQNQILLQLSQLKWDKDFHYHNDNDNIKYLYFTLRAKKIF